MVNLADIAREATRGGGLDAWSRQYGLDPAQTAKVVEALLPAFTLAFQRMALNPSAFADFTRSLGSGRYAPFFDNPGQSHAANGAALVQQLFRSPEAAQQVAAQTAALTGVGVQVMQQLLPTLAATLMGGVYRYATVEGYAGLLREWGDALKSASEQLDPPKPQDPWSAWQAAASQMMGLKPAAPPPPKPPPEPTNVLDAWVAMVGAMTGMATPSSESASTPPSSPARSAPRRVLDEQEPPPAATTALPDGEAPREDAIGAPGTANGSASTSPKAADEANPFETMSQIFETGREVQAQHLSALQSILDNVWGPARKT